MSIAARPSKITLPSENLGWNHIIDFLVEKFPHIDKTIWLSRIDDGKVHWLSGELIDLETAFIVSKTLCYYREVENEPLIPFKYDVLYQDDHLIVADKPHFLPVTPGGQYVNQCLLVKLRDELKYPDIAPLHRLDKDTAGLVMFSSNPKTRGIYSQLFANRQINKEYRAIAQMNNTYSIGKQWDIKNRLIKAEPSFLMKESQGDVNAHSKIELIDINQNLGLFKLSPITGKTHQLRLHMMKIGFPIHNDPFYPNLQPKTENDFKQPLQLLAKTLSFTDPLSGKQHHFESKRTLKGCLVHQDTTDNPTI